MGKPIPEEYRALLFPTEKLEYELSYAGKTRAEDVLAETWSVPLQPLKTFNAPKDSSKKEWSNRLIFGDNLQVIKRLIDDKDIKGHVKLVYIDPPFATKHEFQGGQNQRAYQDKIAGAEFVEFLRKRLLLIRELLHAQGSIYLHLDQKKVHYAKVVMDEIFGEDNFRNEIIWRNTNAHSKAETFGQIHQTILFYSRSPKVHFNKIKRPRFKGYEEAHYRHSDARGTFRNSDLTAEGIRTGDSGKKWLGYNPTAVGRHWAIPGYAYELVDEDIRDKTVTERLDFLLKAGLIVPPEKRGGQPQIKRYKTKNDGTFLQDIWAYQPYTKGIYAESNECIDEDVSWSLSQEERTEYPTQKPEGLLARIIRSSSHEGDIVMDAFAGSGTTLSAAERLGRRWIGIDCGKLAIYSIQKRLLNLTSDFSGNPKKADSFTLYNAGLYDFARVRDLPWNDYRLFALQLFQVTDEQHKLNGVTFDGYKGSSDVLIFNYQEKKGVQLDDSYVAELNKQIGRKARKEIFIVAPAACVTFLEDYKDIDGVRYYILRIPYSIIDEIHDRPFREIRQPLEAKQVNDVVEAVGFDFIQLPRLKARYFLRRPRNSLFPFATIRIDKFESQAMTRHPREFSNRETLSMVMVDYDYRGNGEGVFSIDEVFYRSQIQKDGWEVRLDPQMLGARVMLIYIDIFGNELREVKSPRDFGIKSS